MPRIRRNNKRIRAGAGRTRKEDCCCDETPVNPDCAGLPLTWLLSISNMPPVVTGSLTTPYFRNCVTGGNYAPWTYCASAGRSYDQAFRGFCNQVTGSFELPYLGRFGAEYRWGFATYTWANAKLQGPCGASPSSHSGGFILSVSKCVLEGHSATELVGLEVDIANVLEFDAIVSLPPGQTLLDVSTVPLTVVRQGACLKYQTPANCTPNDTFEAGPSGFLTPNG